MDAILANDTVTPVLADINLQLAGWHRDNTPQDTRTSINPVPSIKIDNKTYDLDSLSQEAKANLQMLQATEAEIQRLNLQLAIAQTARLTYSNALKAALPVVPGGDTIKHVQWTSTSCWPSWPPSRQNPSAGCRWGTTLSCTWVTRTRW